jgi:NIPSNAP
MKTMNRLIFLAAILILILTNCGKTNPDNVSGANSERENREFYQIKTYTFENDEQVKITDRYLENAYLPVLKKMNIKSIGVFKLRPSEKDSTLKTYVLIPFQSMDQFLELEAKLDKDSVYLAAGKEYLNAAHDHKPYQRIESTLLKAFVDMPMMKTPNLEGPRAERIYELRSYESATERLYQNKVDMFNAGGEVKLFDRLGFNAVFYGEVISGSKMPNLMYMTTFTNQASRDEHWKAFGDAPEWKELIAMEKYKNNVSHADLIFLYPTEYSDY